MQPLISILSLWLIDNTIFDGLQLPEGLFGKKQQIIDMILAECGELNTLYSSPAFCKGIITAWAALNIPTWEKMYNAQTTQYNPIHNFLRSETEEENTEGTKATEQTQTATSTSTDISKLYRNAFNSGEQTQANTNESTATIANDNNTTGNQKDTGKTTRNRAVEGTSGTDKIQDMIKAEFDVAQLNVANIIVEDFKNKFCILVY